MTVAVASGSVPAKPQVVLGGSAGNVLGWALPLYLLLLSGGFAFLRSPSAALRGGQLNIDRAAFDSVNAVTGTGFVQTVGQDELKPNGKLAIEILIAAGSVLTLTIGGTLVSRIAQLDYSELTIALASIGLVASSGILGAATLSDTAMHGALQGVGAIGNCGLLLDASPGNAGNETVMLVLLPLTILGGLGVPVVLECGQYLFKRRRLSAHTVAVLSTTAFIYVLGTVALGVLGQFDAANASAMTINSRSAGFSLLPIDSISRLGQWLVLALMAIGAAPGGSGGGWKVTTPLVLWRGALRNFRGKPSSPMFSIAIVWSAVFAVLVFGGSLVLIGLQPQIPADRSLFLAVSAATNTGLSYGPVSMVGGGLYALGGIALLGRLLPMGVLLWCCRAGERSSVGDGVAVAVG